MTPNAMKLTKSGKDSDEFEKSFSGSDQTGNCNVESKFNLRIGTDHSFKRKIVWFNTLGFIALHAAALYGLYVAFQCRVYTIFWSLLLVIVSGQGITLGAHRLFSHKAFKATFSLRMVLILFQTIAGQNCLYIWVRDHRQHHKFSDTDADPHNANRGFFFSHVGWLMSRKHPAVITKGKTIDMSDLEADNLVMFQKKYYKPLYVLLAIAMPICVPIYFWEESLYSAFFVSYLARFVFVLNLTWLVNSAAHVFGTKPYDRSIRPVESTFVALVTGGEGWHNYHHTFPWDYRAAELGMKFNITTFLINTLAKVGLAYDLKTAPYTMMEHRVLRTGDGSHHRVHHHHHHHEEEEEELVLEEELDAEMKEEVQKAEREEEEDDRLEKQVENEQELCQIENVLEVTKKETVFSKTDHLQELIEGPNRKKISTSSNDQHTGDSNKALTVDVKTLITNNNSSNSSILLNCTSLLESNENKVTTFDKLEEFAELRRRSKGMQ